MCEIFNIHGPETVSLLTFYFDTVDRKKILFHIQMANCDNVIPCPVCA